MDARLTFDDQTILSLLELRDPIGIVSIYVGVTPERAAAPTPPWAIAVRNGLRDLRQRVRDELPHDAWRAVHTRLDELGARIEALLEFKEPGRGRALFAAVREGTTVEVRCQLPFPDQVVFADTAYIRPLVAAWDEGRPAGVAVAHRSGVRLLEWQLGLVEDLGQEDFHVDREVRAREKRGPSGDNPALPGSGVVHRDRFEQRVEENLRRQLRAAAERVMAEVRTRRWDRLVVGGHPSMRHALIEEIHGLDGVAVIAADHEWEDYVSAAQLADEVAAVLRSVQRQYELTLVEAVFERALGGGAGVLGAADVLAALEQGRVEHLVYVADLTLTGWRTADGRLTVHRPETTGEATEEPLLVERMVEQALRTRARVTPIEGEAAEKLALHGGVGALLRW